MAAAIKLERGMGNSLGIVQRGWRLSGLALLGAVVGGCGTGLPADDPARAFSRVFLMGTELLEKPVVGHDTVFAPSNPYTFRTSDGGESEGVGFFVLLAMVDEDLLRVKLVDRDAGPVGELRRVAGPQGATESDLAGEARPFHEESRAALENGLGAYWVAEALPTDPSGAQRVGVLLPRGVLTAFSHLEFYTSSTARGTPLGAIQIELAREFYYMAVIGDSVQWGNGLREADKVSSRVAATIEHRTGRRVIIQRFAHSGATVLPGEGEAVCELNCSGEVPTAATSITLQAELIEHPEEMDLILMDGCINDVGVGTIIDIHVLPEDLAAQATQFCDEAVGGVVRRLAERAPSAQIVVTGYFPIVGPESDIFGLQQWASTQGKPLDGKDEVIAALVSNSVLFLETAHAGLRAAVERANATLEAPRVSFADPGFTAQNAVFAPESLLWGLSRTGELFGEIELDLLLFPEDPIQNLRLEACFEPESISDLLFCLYASVAHPNPQGAERYAAEIIEQLEHSGQLPVSDEAGSGVDRWTTFP